MQLSGFTHAPFSKYLLLTLVASALAITATDTKHYFYFNLERRSSHHGRNAAQASVFQQWWRVLTWSLAYTNSTEVLFAGVTVYQLRVVERIWGTRKVVSFILATLPYTVLLPPLLLLALRFLTFSTTFSFLPSGPTAIIFALLAQYHAAIPYSYRYRVGTTAPTSSNASNAGNNQAQANQEDTKGIELTSKSTSYLPALQLAFSQLPGSLVPAVVGWCVGYAWRLDLLPGVGNKWRVPAWVVGGGSGIGSVIGSARSVREGEEGSTGLATGVGQDVGAGEGRRRGMGNG